MHHVAIIRTWKDGSTDEQVVSRKTVKLALADAAGIVECNAADGFDGDLLGQRMERVTYVNGSREIIAPVEVTR